MDALLIPNAIFIPNDMQKKFGKVTPAMVPLGNLSMLENICQQYSNIAEKIYIICYEQVDNIEKFIIQKNISVEIIKLDRIEDLGYSIFRGFEYIKAKNANVDKIYINFADSLVEYSCDISKIKNFIFSANPAGSDLWTYFKNCNGKITSILDKKFLQDNPNVAMQYDKVFVGVFGISNIEDFTKILHEKINNKTNDIDSFYATLLEYGFCTDIEFISVDKWYDVGHSESYFKAKSGVAARFFNSIQIDDMRGLLTKMSSNKKKLIDEIRWYLKLPDNIQYLTPRIYDYSLDVDEPFVTMEFYGYHTLHESYIYGELPMIRWREVFKKLFFLIEDMEQYKVEPKEDKINESLYSMYVEKTFDRVNILREKKEFEIFFSQKVIINGKIYESLDYYLDILPKIVNDIIISKKKKYFNIIHGDLCFANILVEDNYNFMRVIDPRGSFGFFDIYGDSDYEIAKLLHSLEGKYDFIIEDLFKVDVHDNSINFSIFEKNKDVYKVFSSVFKRKLTDIMPIRLIESTLFLGMIPLHNDYIDRQYVMLATGIMLLDNVVKQYYNI